MAKIKVVIIEDQEEIRKGYEFLINSSNDFSCVGYATAEAAINNIYFDKPEAIQEIYNGGAPMSSQIAKMVVNSFQKNNADHPDTVLSEREIEILNLLTAGFRNKEVAEKLSISLSTVKSHVYNIYQKLHVTSRVEAVNKMTRRRK